MRYGTPATYGFFGVYNFIITDHCPHNQILQITRPRFGLRSATASGSRALIHRDHSDMTQRKIRIPSPKRLPRGGARPSPAPSPWPCS